MSLVVAKFGGTSVASPERIQNVAKRLIQKKEEGNQVVAVVSAMGKTTDELLDLANAVMNSPARRSRSFRPIAFAKSSNAVRS